MKKNISLLLLFVGMTVMSFAQLAEGKISYTMDFSSDNPDMAMGLAMMQGSKMEMNFVPGKSRTDVSMGSLGTMTTIADEKSKKVLTLMNMMGQKTAIESTTDKLPDNEKAPEYDVEITNETKDILGYKCTKAIMTTDEGTAMTIWYTKDIVVATQGQNYYNSQMPGFPMAFNMTQSGMNIQMTVVGIEKKAPSKSLFETKVPDGYTLQTMEELQKSMGQ